MPPPPGGVNKPDYAADKRRERLRKMLKALKRETSAGRVHAMTGVQNMLNKNIFTNSLTFILYYALQRNTKYVVRVMCVLHSIFFMHLSDCNVAAFISDI